MTIALSANTPRVSYTVSQGATQTSFAVPFVFFTSSTDLNVFVDNVARTFDASTSNTSLFTVSGGNGSTGTVTTSVTGATGGSTVVITRAIPLSRTTDFPSSGAFEISKLNTELDTVTAIQSDFNDSASRAIRLQDSDSAVSMELPLLASRKGTVLGFNATTGAAEAGPTITAVQSLADVTASINLLGTSAVVEDMGLLATSANITAMGHLGTSANVTAMGLLGTSDVVADMALLGTSDVVADMALLATTDVIADMAQLANTTIIDDLAQLANTTITDDMAILATSDNVTAMGLLGTSANVTAMGLLGTSTVVEDMGFLGTSANVTAMGLLGTSANVTAMGLLGTSAVVTDMSLLGTSAVVTDMDILATSANVTNMATLGASGVVGNIATVAGVASNVTTVANNISGVNSFAERYRVQSGVPSSDNDIGDLVFDTSANTLKVFGSSGYQNAGSSVNGTSERFTYNITGTPTTLTGASGTGFAEANSNTLAYDAGFIDVYLNGVKQVNGTDVTVTSGTSVVFASALSNGDVVDIVTFGTFQVAAVNASNLSSGTIPDARFPATLPAISGANLTNLDATDLTGTVASARITGSYTGITGTGALDAGSITSGFGNIDIGSSTITTTGAISGGTLTGTLQTASQTNITSVGTLSGLAVSGATTITTADNTAQLTLKSTDADANAGPLLDMKRDSSSPADGDFLGQINFIAENDASEEVTYAQITGRTVDVTDGTEDGRIAIKTMRNGSSRSALDFSATETVFNDDGDDINFRVESDDDTHCLFVNGGNNQVCVGTTTAGLHKMVVKGNTGGNAVFKVDNSATSGNQTAYLSHMDGSGANSANSAHFQGFNGANNHYLLGNGTTTFTSDEVAKKNIETTRDGYLEDLAKLRVVKYNWKEDEDGTPKELGLIAQEVEKVFPKLVMLDFDPQIADKDKKKMIKVSVLPFMLLKALQEANTKITELETENKTQATQIADLISRVTALESA